MRMRTHYISLSILLLLCQDSKKTKNQNQPTNQTNRTTQYMVADVRGQSQTQTLKEN